MEHELIKNIDKVHTTEMGVIRIKKNLLLEEENVVEWCKEKILLPISEISKKRQKLVYQH